MKHGGFVGFKKPLENPFVFIFMIKNPFKNPFVSISIIRNPFKNPFVYISMIKNPFENPFESKFTLWTSLLYISYWLTAKLESQQQVLLEVEIEVDREKDRYIASFTLHLHIAY